MSLDENKPTRKSKRIRSRAAPTDSEPTTQAGAMLPLCPTSPTGKDRSPPPTDEPASKRLKTAKNEESIEMSDDEDLVEISEEMTNEVEAQVPPPTVCDSAMTSQPTDGFKIFEIPMTSLRQALPIQCHFLSAEDPRQVPVTKGKHKGKLVWVLNTVFGDLDGREMKISFWSEQVWLYQAQKPKHLDCFSFADLQITPTKNDDQFNTGNVAFVGAVNENCKTLTKLSVVLDHKKIQFHKIELIDAAMCGKIVCVKGTVAAIRTDGVMIVQKNERIWCSFEGDNKPEISKQEFLSILGAEIKMTGYHQVTQKLQFTLVGKATTKFVKILKK